MLKPGQLKAFQACGLLLRLQPSPIHMIGHNFWQPSIVHWELLQRFWPCKLAAFEARQLRQVVQAGLAGNASYAAKCLVRANLLTQHAAFVPSLTAFAVPWAASLYNSLMCIPTKMCRVLALAP